MGERTLAVIRSGGKQYLVSPGQTLRLEKLPVEAGKTVVFSDVLLYVSGEEVAVGTPTVPRATVVATVVAHGRGRKEVVFKMKPKKRYRVKKGHRQSYTSVRIEKIERK